MNSAEQFEALVSAHYEALFRFALSLTRMESDARDLTQQTFYVWATKGHQLRDPSKVKTWLFTTLHRAFLETRRRQFRFAHHPIDEFSDQLPAVSPGPADQADCSEVLTALARVDEVYQAAVALFYLEDCSYKDIAAILEVPIGTVKSRIARGIGQLREILQSADSRDSSLNRDPISATSGPGEPAAPSPDSLPRSGRDAASPARTVEPGYDDWDFSSTHLGEQFGAA
jgi:RNA polymerase sigma-70 factor (ECF subfamily)